MDEHANHGSRHGGSGDNHAPTVGASKRRKHAVIQNVVHNTGRWLRSRTLDKAKKPEREQCRDIELKALEKFDFDLDATRAATRDTAPASNLKSASVTRAIPLKRKRSTPAMVHANDIDIHEDDSAKARHLHGNPSEYQVMVEIDTNVQMQEELVYDEAETEDEQEEAEEVDETVAEDMKKLEEDFKGISQKYRLINRIGEGTFSTVYKAEQLDVPADSDEEDGFENRDPMDDYDDNGDNELGMPPVKKRRFNNGKPSRIVALKKIYVTSSPGRILNELELLHELRDSPYICPLLTAFRHHDQVIAVLPYFRHMDFRLYFRDFLTNDLRHYFLSMFSGLHWVHKHGIIHRDIKPTNFLYNHRSKHGVLVDFGLAEREGTDYQPCLCQQPKENRKERFLNSYAVKKLSDTPDVRSEAYPRNDSRPTRRANRAGTRGFRAPEVLLKCTAQTTKIDMWSVGVILLTMLGQRFPFFNSTDDIDAMIEIASIFGRKKMQGVAAMHGSVFETSIETIGDRGFPLDKIVLWASCREKEEEALHPGEVQAVQLLMGLLELDPNKRLSASKALQHEFFTEPVEDEVEKAEREEQEAMEEEQHLRRIAKRERRAAAKMQKLQEQYQNA